MKRLVFLMFLVSAGASAQTDYNFGNAISWQAMLSATVPDSINFPTLSQLSRLDTGAIANLAGILPSEYNWKRAAQYADSVKKVSLGYQRLDAYGREILPEIIMELSMKVMSRNILLDF